ncbi:uncharacterized protein [Leptinotarsa decemlineata]|uniref:uncharacterized protein n=1 Tax=Leptinotarsa decemlineata TaxID=7539 RepID=UPI003D30C218
MDEFINYLVKLLTNNILVHIYSYPHFAIETFIASVICVTHCLLIFEVNNLFRRTNTRAAIKLRHRHPQLKDAESCSYHTISRLHTQIFPQKIETTATRQSYYVPSYTRRLNKKLSNASNFGWVIPTRGDSRIVMRHGYNDRVEHLLSISPSEYVRKDKERKHREAGLRSCIHSLTSLLEKALNNENMELESASREAIKKSINALKENFEHQIAVENNYNMGDFASPSLHSLLGHSVQKKSLRNSLASPHFVSFNLVGNEFERQDKDAKVYKEESLDELNQAYDRKSIEVLHGDQKIPLKNE